MHADDVLTDEAQVRRLVATQFPQWADLPITPVTEFGTDHWLYRLGDDLVVRLPRIGWAVDQAESDQRWLPVLAPHLPLAVSEPVALGQPGEGYPYPWLVVRWLPGENPRDDNVDLARAADDLAGFVIALQRIDTAGGPRATGTARGVALEHLADTVDEHLAVLATEIDADRARAVFGLGLQAGPWPGGGVWLHGDLQAGNLLVRDRRLTAVIDFGCLAVGDPAPDYAPAWSLFAGESRRIFRERSGVDDATWARARAWTMIPALTGLPYYRDTVPAFADLARYRLGQVLADV
jgi:aminoglycoside phosphotransferase (APT) family kinase protein